MQTKQIKTNTKQQQQWDRQRRQCNCNNETMTGECDWSAGTQLGWKRTMTMRGHVAGVADLLAPGSP